MPDMDDRLKWKVLWKRSTYPLDYNTLGVTLEHEGEMWWQAVYVTFDKDSPEMESAVDLLKQNILESIERKAA